MPVLIRSQKLYLLRPDVDAKAALHPERFHSARMDRDGSSGEDVSEPDGTEWEPLPREALTAGVFNVRKLHRVGLTTDAGIGKSTNLKVLQHDLSTPGNGWAPIIPIGRLKSVADFPDLLQAIAREEFAKHDEGTHRAILPRHFDPNRILTNIERLRGRERLTLLFDGLDQASDDSVAVLQDIASTRVLRGGCWYYVARDCGVASRSWREPEMRSHNMGFRLAAVPARDDEVKSVSEWSEAPAGERRSRPTWASAASERFFFEK